MGTAVNRNVGILKEKEFSEFVQLCTTVDFPAIADFNKLHYGWCISLVWPRHKWLRLANCDNITSFSREIFQLMHCQYLGCYEELWPIGGIERNEDEIPILLGRSGRLFAYNPTRCSLVFLQKDIHDFFKYGVTTLDVKSDKLNIQVFDFDVPRFETVETLMRCGILQDPSTLNKNISTHVNDTLRRFHRWRVLHCLTCLDDLARCRDLGEIKEFVTANAGLKIQIKLFLYNELEFGGRRCKYANSRDWRRFDFDVLGHEPVEVLGYLTEINGDNDLIRPLLCIGKSGRVYCYDWAERILCEIADCLHTFARLGFSRYMGDHAYNYIGEIKRVFGRFSTTGVYFTEEYVRHCDSEMSEYLRSRAWDK